MTEIYTDGACSCNPGLGGSAIVIVKNGEKIFSEMYIKENTTNNERELYAVLMALLHLLYGSTKDGKIYSDSKYVVSGINEWLIKWKENKWKNSKGEIIKNYGLWTAVNQVISELNELDIPFSVHHIEGHSGNKWNDMADKLAKQAIKDYKNGNKKE